MTKKETYPKEIQDALTTIADRCAREEYPIRQRQLKLWKKLEKFWHGEQHLFWSDREDNWLSISDALNSKSTSSDAQLYDYVVNIYRAHGESVIAALSATVPAVRFPPDDADNEDDLLAAKTHNKIADLILRHIQSKQTIINTLFRLWNQGSVFAHIYAKQDADYGTAKIPQYNENVICQQCGTSEPMTAENVGQLCPTCQQPLQIQRELTGFEDVSKSRTCIDLYGPIFVKVPSYCTKLEDCGYVILTKDEPRQFLQSLYPEIRESITSGSGYTAGEYDEYERVGRSHPSFGMSQSDAINLLPHQKIWIRPWQFESVDDDKVRKQLYKLFPDGAYLARVGRVFATAHPAKMDDEWRFCKGGLSTFIHSDPIGKPLAPIQELTNLHMNLTEESIEHSIPMTFANPDVVDFELLGEVESRAGTIFPAKAKAGEQLSSAFFETSRGTISRESSTFAAILEKQGQFVVGSMPSVFGGQLEGSSRTASEYAQSRQMALQRLSISWIFFSQFWCEAIALSVTTFIKNMIEDIRYTNFKDGNYVNVYIRQSELSGKVGEIAPESAEAFPITSAQKQALLMKLIEMNNEFLNAAMFDPTNRSVVASALSFPEFNIPGEDQRVKQGREIQAIIQQEPIMVEPDIDDHEIHMEVLKGFMVSVEGLDLKRTNPPAYQGLMQHYMMHKQAQMQAQMQEMMNAGGVGQPGQNQQQQPKENVQ